jgi:hypothetical protein
VQRRFRRTRRLPDATLKNPLEQAADVFSARTRRRRGLVSFQHAIAEDLLNCRIN